MQKLTRRKFIGWGAVTAAGALLPITASGAAQSSKFSPPFSGSPGLATWHVRQWYGNTQWAYRQRYALYGQGQGLHFGVDFFAPCGSQVVAIGDGVVTAIDGPYGAPPHNVVIRHIGGYSSLYGHLHQRASLRIGQSISQGEPIAISGAPSDSDCDTRSHLHLEIRTNGMSSTVNPVNLINADWGNITMGLPDEGLAFEVDLDNPERWQSIYDQPVVYFGSALLNDYRRPWPG